MIQNKDLDEDCFKLESFLFDCVCIPAFTIGRVMSMKIPDSLKFAGASAKDLTVAPRQATISDKNARDLIVVKEKVLSLMVGAKFLIPYFMVLQNMKDAQAFGSSVKGKFFKSEYKTEINGVEYATIAEHNMNRKRIGGRWLKKARTLTNRQVKTFFYTSPRLNFIFKTIPLMYAGNLFYDAKEEQPKETTFLVEHNIKHMLKDQEFFHRFASKKTFKNQAPGNDSNWFALPETANFGLPENWNYLCSSIKENPIRRAFNTVTFLLVDMACSDLSVFGKGVIDLLIENASNPTQYIATPRKQKKANEQVASPEAREGETPPTPPAGLKKPPPAANATAPLPSGEQDRAPPNVEQQKQTATTDQVLQTQQKTPQRQPQGQLQVPETTQPQTPIPRRQTRSSTSRAQGPPVVNVEPQQSGEEASSLGFGSPGTGQTADFQAKDTAGNQAPQSQGQQKNPYIEDEAIEAGTALMDIG